MIKLTTNSVFEYLDEADMIVNTINTKGYMGKGLALEFALRYPEMEEEYIKACSEENIKPGTNWFYNTNTVIIANFATKDDFKNPSKMEWIENGLEELKNYIEREKITKVAIPKLGAGLGGLDWEKVESIIMEKLESTDAEILICLDTKPGYKETNALTKLFNKLESENTGSIGLFKNIEVKGKQSEINNSILKNKGKIKRFRDLAKIEGLGKKTYQKLLKENW